MEPVDFYAHIGRALHGRFSLWACMLALETNASPSRVLRAPPAPCSCKGSRGPAKPHRCALAGMKTRKDRRPVTAPYLRQAARSAPAPCVDPAALVADLGLAAQPATHDRRACTHKAAFCKRGSVKCPLRSESDRSAALK